MDGREQLVAYSRRLVDDGLCVGTAGNISIRDGEQLLITPSNVDAERLTGDDIAVVALDGTTIRAARRPSSELPLHRTVYEAVDAGAVVHTHSPYATVLSTVVSELPAIHYTINDLGGPVRVAAYATFGTSALGEHVRAALDGRTGAILANHGTVTYGATLAQAYDRAVLLEWLAALYWRACQIGTPTILDAAELEAVRRQSERLGYGRAADH